MSITDGASEATTRIVSNLSWQRGPAAVTFDDIYRGEVRDMAMDQAGWDTPAFDASTARGWAPATAAVAPGGKLVPAAYPPVLQQPPLEAQTVTRVSPGRFLFTFARNTAAMIRLELPVGIATPLINISTHEQLLNGSGNGPYVSKQTFLNVNTTAARGLTTLETRFT